MGKFAQLQAAMGFSPNTSHNHGDSSNKKAKKKMTPQDIFVLKNKVHEATRKTSVEEIRKQFAAMDKKKRGGLSFEEFRRAVRRANIKVNVISDEDLEDIVQVVDLDGSGQIDVDEFLGFLRPLHIPDVRARASSWTDDQWDPDCDMETAARGPGNTVNSVGVSMTLEGYAIHTGHLNGHAWNSRPGATKKETWIEFELPDVYFVDSIHLWNFMSWDRNSQKQDCLCALYAFDLSYSLNGTHWYKMGRVEGLTEVPSTGVQMYFGESIQNTTYGGRETLPHVHRKCVVLTVKDLFGPPVKFLKFDNMDNFGIREGGNSYGLNGVYFYGKAASGDCVVRGPVGGGMMEVPAELCSRYQFVVNLDLSHNKLSCLPAELARMVLVQRMDLSYNLFETYPDVLNEGDFSTTLKYLDMSHNLLTSLSPDIAHLRNLTTLLIAGHYWDLGGLPEELADLRLLRKLDLRGIPYLHEWLRSEENRARHKLPPSAKSDHSVVTDSEFVAYVQEHPLVLRALNVEGARGMFLRFAAQEKGESGHAHGHVKKETNKEVCILAGTATQLDRHVMEILSKPFCGVPRDVYELDFIEEILLERAGVDIYRYPGALPTLPAPACSSIISRPGSLGVLTLFEEQAASFPGAVCVQVPNICSVTEVLETQDILAERGMLIRPKEYFTATASFQEIQAGLKEERLKKSIHMNPPIPREMRPRYRDTQDWRRSREEDSAGIMGERSANYVEIGPEALHVQTPQYLFTPTDWTMSRGKGFLAGSAPVAAGIGQGGDTESPAAGASKQAQGK